MNGEAKVYDVTPAEDFLTARLTAADPFRWTTDMTTAEISAWWPYTDSDNDGIPDATIPPVVVKKDQSSDENYANSDYIAVSNQQVSFGTPAELQFSHRTARIVLKLASSTVDLSSVSISINNLSAVNGNPQVITPRKVEDGTYEALVAPQRIMAQTQIASITTLGGKTFIYKISNETEWAEGKYYTYTIELVE
ncbi:fimbrillin family protein [Alistipes sp. An66]|uniref:fimbrillin family protein n=2 Tax=Alistipes TaxID=239759 RepID=UPI0019516F5C|nr:fimbrillin family protein [Alistipes sp. An66]HIY15008.1 fimbrillin family protein [Candidatus Alistipes cottocaccae]